MKRVQSDDPDRLTFRGGGGLFLAIGVVTLIFGLVPVGAHLLGEPDPPNIALVLIPLGLVFIFARRGMDIDVRSRTYVRWYRCLVPLRRRHGDLDEFDHVLLTSDEDEGKVTYQIGCGRRDGRRVWVVADWDADVIEAHSEAVGLAKALGVRLVDKSEGFELVCEVGDLDRSLRDRRARLGLDDEALPERPRPMQSTLHTKGRTITFEIPPVGLTDRRTVRLIGLAGVLPLVAGGLFVVFIRAVVGVPPGESWLVLLLLGAWAAVLTIRCAWTAMQRTTVVASPKELRVVHRGVWRAKETAIPSKELQVLDVLAPEDVLKAQPEAIVVHGAHARTSFGAHLSREEKAYIKAVIERVVTA